MNNFLSLQAIDERGYGLVWVHASEAECRSGQPPLDSYHIYAKPLPGQSAHDALIAALPTATPLRGPLTVTMRQARLALLQSGQLDELDAAVAALDEAARITWEYSSTVERANPLVEQLGAALAIDLDALFEAASQL